MNEMENNPSDTALDKLFTQCSEDEALDAFSPNRRSIRIHGHSTTIRLEKAFWAALEGIADQENKTLIELITSVHDHCPQMDTRNLASCLRVVCLRVSSE